CPHAGHRRGIATGGKVSKITISTVKPVRTGLRFCGHLKRMWFTADPPAAFKRTTNLISHLIDVASQVTALCLMQRHDLDEAPAGECAHDFGRPLAASERSDCNKWCTGRSCPAGRAMAPQIARSRRCH